MKLSLQHRSTDGKCKLTVRRIYICHMDQIHASSIFKVALKNSDVFAACFFFRASIQLKADESKMYILSALNRRSAFQTRLSDIRDAIINNAFFFPPPAPLFPLGHGRREMYVDVK